MLLPRPHHGLGREQHGYVARTGRTAEGAPSPHAARRTDRDRLPAAGREIAARLTAAGFTGIRSDTLALKPPVICVLGEVP
jgi:hypothetical protein